MSALEQRFTPLRDSPPTVSEIKDALRNSPTAADVNAAVRHYAPAVIALDNSDDKTDREMAIQIRNLASYRRKAIANGWDRK